MKPTPWLEKIKSPEDLRGLRYETLEEICSEIRETVAEVCSCNGGHFAPSLGVVELTVALHRVMDTPKDRLVWDVGHQSYPHKLLTGRFEQFPTLRQMGGLSGFPKRDESPYDTFGVGHASTAISAATGMALARDQQGEDYRVIAVCGDGAMTGGLCYEALNNLGYIGPDMLIILNDNKMSISPNIGAMSHYFNQIVTTDLYNKSKATAETLINRVPAFGKKMVDFSQRLERSIKNLIIPEETVFEKMGIRYLGPVDGHDLKTLIDILNHIKDLKGPILLHVKTVKGKGYPYSENDPEKWHSGADFIISTGEQAIGENQAAPKKHVAPSYTDVFGTTLAKLADKDERIVGITAAMATGTGLDLFAEKHPKRLYDVGIAESHAVCCAAGMACDGLKPVVAIYSSFYQRAYDQIIHDVALQKLPVTFALDRAGLVGHDGPTHHGVFDLSFLRVVPDLVVMAPRDEQEMQRMMKTAAEYDGPIAYRYPRSRGWGLPLEDDADKIQTIPIGQAEIIREPGSGEEKNVAFLSIGTMAYQAHQAADMLQEQGFGAAVVDMRFVKPLDREMLTRIASEYELIVTLEENVRAGGFGSAVREALEEIDFHKSVLTIGIPDAFIEHGPIPELFKKAGLDAISIADRTKQMLATV
ncbi:MAG: 1-deoxy-D-xylulose-5-phosphate synthase [Candidatus Sumerlaeia bacterium]